MKNSKHEEDIGLIKDLMEKSSKFSNLSGIAVIATGFLAIIGASLIYLTLVFLLVKYTFHMQS